MAQMSMLISLLLLATLPMMTTAFGVGHAAAVAVVASNTHTDVDNGIHKECIEPTATVKYIFFAENETSTNYYAIETVWVVQHLSKVRKALKREGAFVFDHNPDSKCDWTQSKSYEWEHDTVLYKYNQSSTMDALVYTVTKENCAIEWALAFSWIWGPIGFGLLWWMIHLMAKYIKTKKATPEKTDLQCPHYDRFGCYA